MRRTPNTSLMLALAGAMVLQAGVARAARAQDPQDVSAQQPFARFTSEQLDNLLAPVALYADPLLAQVLLAATFPDQIAEAAQYVRGNGTDAIDEQPWDVSVKAVAHYPTVLNTMDTRIDWTTALGQAYAAQSTDVMRSVQRLRSMARAQGNLLTSAEQEVVVNDDYIRIWPAQPRVIYVPVYDPEVVYVRPIHLHRGYHTYFSFGVPFPLGAWLIYDWDWPSWRMYYTGWYGGGWIGRSRPFIHITNVYVHPRYRRIWYNRDVLHRYPNYSRVGYYDAIHPGVRFADRAEPRHAVPRVRDAAGDRGGSPGSDANGIRRAVPRDQGAGVSRSGAGAVTTTRPVEARPAETRPAVERIRPDAPVRPAESGAQRVNVDRRPAADRPSGAAPADAPAKVDRVRWYDVPAETPQRDRVDARPAVEPPRANPVRDRVESRPAVERPRVESRPSVERAPERVESRPAERPRVESRPAERPRVESRPEPRSRPESGQRSGGQARPRERDRG